MTVSKVKVAKGIYGAAYVVGGALVLGVLGVIFWFLSLWFHAHFLSFAIVVGFALLVGVLVGGGCALNWADGVIADNEKEEKEAILRVQEEKKMVSYKKKWGEQYEPPKDYTGRLIQWDRPPEEKQRQNAYNGRI